MLAIIALCLINLYVEGDGKMAEEALEMSNSSAKLS
jgi:hypothetical protein